MPIKPFAAAIAAVSWIMAAPTAMALELKPYVFASMGGAEPDLGELEGRYDGMATQANDNGGTASIESDERDVAGSLGLGLQLHRYFALELSYYHLGSYEMKANGYYSNGAGSMNAQGSAEVNVRGWGLQGVIIAPLTRRLSGTLSLGAARLKTDVEADYSSRYESAFLSESDGEHYEESFDDTVGNFGVGARYAFNEAFSMRLDYNYLGGVGSQSDTEESINLLSAGLVYYF